MSHSAEFRKLVPTKDMLMVTSGCPSAKLDCWGFEVSGSGFRAQGLGVGIAGNM